MTKTLMPCFAALEAHNFPARTHSFVFATTRLPDCVFAVWARTPFQAGVLSDFDISLNAVIKLNVFLFAEIRHLLIGKVIFTALFHASDFKHFARLNARLQILLDARRATLVPAFKCEYLSRHELVANRANRIRVRTWSCSLMLSG